jgi:hypothetical protein
MQRCLGIECSVARVPGPEAYLGRHYSLGLCAPYRKSDNDNRGTLSVKVLGGVDEGRRCTC